MRICENARGKFLGRSEWEPHETKVAGLYYLTEWACAEVLTEGHDRKTESCVPLLESHSGR